MKNLVFIFVFLMLMSCSGDSIETGEFNSLEEINALKEFSPAGKWTLVKISGPQYDHEKTGEEMGFFDTYILNSDGTFIKSRTEGNTTTKASGRFDLIHYWPAINPEPVVAYVKFTHSSENEIIFTCDDNLVEIFYFTPDNRLVSSRGICEGMVLTFTRNN